MIIEAYFLLMLIFCLTDIKYWTIPNYIVVPAIFISLYFTNQWWAVVVASGIGALFYYNETICPHCGKVVDKYQTPVSFFSGGDLKLLVFAAALIGFQALVIFAISRVLVFLFSRITNKASRVQYAPFFTLSSIIYFLAIQATILIK
jgi:Flp pilus assembly protein protease CpaA